MNTRMQDAINSTNGTYNGIQLLFKHALSNIEFNVARADYYVGAQIYVNRIRLINVAKKATFEQNAESSTPVWRDHDFNDHTILCFGNTNGTTDFSVDSKEPTPLLEDNEGHPVLAIPQSLIVTSRAADLQPQLEITYSIISPGSTIKVRNKKTIDLSSLNVLRWEMGKKYIYNIKISLTTIKVNIGVDNWDEVL